MVINNIPFLVELGDVLSELQSQLKMNGIELLGKIQDTPNNIMVCCPYHKDGKEKRPSAGIKKTDGTFHCFTCGETHSLQEVISYCFGHYDDVMGAFGWEWLLKNFLTVSIEERKDIEIDFSRTNNSVFNMGSENFVSEEELDSYRVYHPYMWKRKLTPEIVDIFDIGYDEKSKCITFPIRDAQGRTLFIARRSVMTKFFNYPQGVEKPVYGLYEILSLKTGQYRELFPDKFLIDELIICESMLDALTCWVYGKPAVALNGLGNDLQFAQLQKMPFRKFILATDNDEAGMKARKRLRYHLKNKLVTEYKLPFGKKDINELTKEEFDNLIEIM